MISHRKREKLRNWLHVHQLELLLLATIILILGGFVWGFG
jgi:hypothetical protein